VFCDHVDDYIFSPERGLRTFQLIPPIAGQVIHEAKASDEWAKAGISVSDRLDTERRAASKGPLAYRVRKEGKRMARRLKQRWQRAAQGAERLHLRALSHHIEDPKTPDETAH
jgi:hypothetical protein